jgi:hypothetical protein
MKRQAFSLISLLTLLLVAGSAIAQTVHVRADIPFNFAVGNKTLPAGTYDVGTIGMRDSKTCAYPCDRPMLLRLLNTAVVNR